MKENRKLIEWITQELEHLNYRHLRLVAVVVSTYLKNESECKSA